MAAQIDDELLPKKVVNVSSSTMPGICHLRYVFISIVISIHCNIFNNNINLTHFIKSMAPTNYIVQRHFQPAHMMYGLIKNFNLYHKNQHIFIPLFKL